MKIHPIGERVVLKPVKAEEKTKSGIYLPKSTEEKKQGKVIEAGTFHDGKPLPLKHGDKIIYGGYSSEEYEIAGEKYLIVEFKDIVARIEDTPQQSPQKSNMSNSQKIQNNNEKNKEPMQNNNQATKNNFNGGKN